MIPIAINDSHDLHRRLLQRCLHRLAHFRALCSHRAPSRQPNSPFHVATNIPRTKRREGEDHVITGLGPRRRERDLQHPHLPTHLLFGLAAAEPTETATPPLLLEKLHRDLPAQAAVRGRGGRELPDQRGGARVDQGLELDVGDGGEGEVEDFDGGGADGGEVAVEEDGVEDAWRLGGRLAMG